MIKFKKTYSNLEEERDNAVSVLFDERASIIMHYRVKHGTNKPCTDEQWSSYLADIKISEGKINDISANIKKIYKSYERKLLNLTKVRCRNL